MSEESGHRIAEKDSDRMEALNQFRSAASISMTPELFEKLYLSPQKPVMGDFRAAFGNPAPIALIGFLLSLSPLSCALMGWRGAGGLGAATIAVYFFQGGVLMTLGGIFELILGNSFQAAVFCAYGTFFLAYGGTLNPAFDALGAYVPSNATSPAAALQTQGFNATLGFWFLFMGVLSFIFLICSLRTNIVLFTLFLSLSLSFSLTTGAHWSLASNYAGNAKLANTLVVGAGACNFVACLAGWYTLLEVLLNLIDFPIQLPVGDLSNIIKGRSSKLRRD